MELGTVVYQNEIYNLDYMTSDEISALFHLVEQNTKEENCVLSAKLRSVYANRLTQEIVRQKVGNQLNSMKASILNINPKFQEKSKNYEKVNAEMTQELEEFEEVLKRFADIFDGKMQDLIYQKLELELKWLIATNQENVNQTEKKSFFKKRKTAKNKQENDEIAIDTEKLKKQIQKNVEMQKRLMEQKQTQIFSAMEVGNNAIAVGVKKRRNIKNIAKFFHCKFNPYKVIQKNVLEPFGHRIDEFKVNQLKKVDGKAKEFDFAKIQEKIEEIVKKKSN